MEKWTLAEGLKKLSLDTPDDAEISDLGLSKRRFTLDVSLANGEEDSVEGGNRLNTLLTHVIHICWTKKLALLSGVA